MSKNSLQLRVAAISYALRWFALPVILTLVAALLPASISAQPIPPGEVELEGTVEVLHEDRDVDSRYIYFLNTTAAEQLEMHFGANPPALVSGDRIRARAEDPTASSRFPPVIACKRSRPLCLTLSARRKQS